MTELSEDTFVTGGTVHHLSRFYIARSFEEEVFKDLRARRYVTLVGSRQVGKTSLLQKIQATVESSYGWASALIDLSTINDRAADFSAWAALFCRSLVDQLRDFLKRKPNLPVPATTPELMEYWARLAQLIEKPRLLVLLDEASAVPDDVRDLFYSTIRSMDSARTMSRPNPHLSRYGFAFAGVFEPERLVRDRRNSPFNVSRIFHLPDFNAGEVEALVAAGPRSEEGPPAAAVAEAIHGWTEGHPYLTQWLGELMSRQGAIPAADLRSRVDAAAAQLTDLARDNIDPMVSVSLDEEADRALLQQVLAGAKVTFSRAANPSVARLELSGALKSAPGYVCQIRNRIYDAALRRAFGLAAPERAQRVFISYSSQDAAFVQRLTEDLRQSGIGFWLDSQDVDVGESIVEEVTRGLNESTDLVVVLSKASLASPWVQTELNATLMQALSGKGIQVRPVLIDHVPRPFLLSHLAFADFRTDYQRGLQSLLAALRDPRETPAPIADAARAEPSAPRRAGPAAPARDLGDLRRLITRNLSESDVGQLWFDTLRERMPDATPAFPLSKLVIRLLEEADSRDLIEELVSNLKEERPDLGL